MNTIKKIIFSLFIGSLVLTSCNRDNEEAISGNGDITLKFENGFGNLGQIVLNSTTQTSTSGQKHQLSLLKYIVSNIVLIKEDGTEVKYNYNNPDKGAFIINQENAVAGEVHITLKDIAAANYSKIRFGIGISNDSYQLGQNGQAEFWTKCQAEGLTWSWAAGYIDMKIEGKYGSDLGKNFQHHYGKKMSVTANPDVYREITLALPTSAKVRTNITPAIHFMVDFNKWLSGNTSIILDETNQVNMSGTGVAQIGMDNLSKAFTVEHVHND